MEDALVCLSCGREVGAGCSCPPLSTAPSARGPYRAAAERITCPRCAGRLVDEPLHDISALHCNGCQGFFLDRATIDTLTSPNGHALRIAFPKRARGDADSVVRYLSCPVCHGVMNRTIFARVSGVIVDVCKTDGIWFDTGEINAIVDFVEAGGMVRAHAKERALRAEEEKRVKLEHERVRGSAYGLMDAQLVGPRVSDGWGSGFFDDLFR